MRKLLPGLLMALATGCATVDQRAEEIGDARAQANDIELKNAERLVCQGASMGAVRRAYADKPAKLKAYLLFCGWETFPEGETDESETR